MSIKTPSTAVKPQLFTISVICENCPCRTIEQEFPRNLSETKAIASGSWSIEIKVPVVKRSKIAPECPPPPAVPST